VTLAEKLARLPAPRVVPGARRTLRDAFLASRSKLVVLDDDPTGTQTVHGVRVCMDWSAATLRAALARPEPLFYVSTNSRSLSRPEAEALAHEIGRSLRSAAEQSGIRAIIASRSDSTLRGHYPAEVAAIASELASPPDGVILVPAFFDAGRYTIDNVHWVETAGGLVPAHETEFARDPDFGYKHGDLREWVQERTGGAVPAAAVICISLGDIRGGGPVRVSEILERARGGVPIIANAACDEDLEVLALGVLSAERRGMIFIYRTSASFVKVRGGIDDRPLLARSEAGPGPGPGLVVAGSWVARTTEQIDRLLATGRVVPAEISVSLLVSGRTRGQEVRKAAGAASDALARGSGVLVYTTRARLDTADFLAAGRTIMSGLCDVVGGIRQQPGFLVAKGGITSIALARSALGCREAEVLGQILKGVPVWRLGAGSRWSEVPYVVFPGNVGDAESLREVFDILTGESPGRRDSV
jgi:uncharacterized protein YgbK (DUF1537 family)